MRDIPHLIEENKEIEKCLARLQAKNAAIAADIEQLVLRRELTCCCGTST